MLTILEQAQRYLNDGISVFPIPKPDGKEYDGKKALIQWSEYQNRIATIDEINNWFGNGNNYNIAIVTGNISRVFVIDIDGNKSKKLFQEKVIPILSTVLQNKIENTALVKTGGGGGHIPFRYRTEDFADGISTKKYVSLGEHDEIAIKGNGGYVIGIGSIHANGRPYELAHADLQTIEELSKEEVTELLNALDTLTVSNDDNETENNIQEVNDFTVKLDKDEISKIVKSLTAENDHCVYSKGNRNAIVFALSGYLHKHSIDEQSILAVIDELTSKNGDEEKKSRFNVVKETCRKSRWSKDVSGHNTLLKTLTIILGGNNSRAKQILHSEINGIIHQARNRVGFNFDSIAEENSNNNEQQQSQQQQRIEKEKIKILSIPEAARILKNDEYVKVQGIVATVLPLRKLNKDSNYICINCNWKTKQIGVRLPSGKPHLYEKAKPPGECITCGEKTFESLCTYVNAVVIELRDPNTFSDIDPLHVVLFDHDTEDTYSRIGETATITGRIYIIEQPYPRHRSISFLYAESVKYESNQGEVVITKYDIEAIERFTRQNREHILDILATKMVAPNVIGEVAFSSPAHVRCVVPTFIILYSSLRR